MGDRLGTPRAVGTTFVYEFLSVTNQNALLPEDDARVPKHVGQIYVTYLNS